MKHIQDDKFYDTNWLFEVSYSGILPCPNCMVSLAAYLQESVKYPYSSKKPKVIYLEFGKHRDAKAVLNEISSKLVGQEYVTPAFYHHGTAFIGRRDISQYKALVRGEY